VCRRDPHTDRPWRRSDFRQPDPMSWVRANRARLVGDCLTLCQAWIAAGRPRGGRSIGAFENWAHVLRGVLEVAGMHLSPPRPQSRLWATRRSFSPSILA
jgi:hypothetical protein